MHSHAEYLRSEREKVYGEAQETTGASRINKTDVFYGKTGEKVEIERLKRLLVGLDALARGVPAERAREGVRRGPGDDGRLSDQQDRRILRQDRREGGDR